MDPQARGHALNNLTEAKKAKANLEEFIKSLGVRH